jgi:sensor histidine kinase regulating citrate/malate metabolism
MFNSLTVRAIIPITVAVTGFVVVCCILLYSSMKSDLIDDAIEYESGMADTVVRSARYAMLQSDREMLRKIIDNIGAQQNIEHIRIFNKKGLVMFSHNHREINSVVDKQSAGCKGCHAGAVPTASLGAMEKARRFVNEQGREVIGITAPIYNDPACSSAACHFHDPRQKVLGTLDIGVSSKHLTRTLHLLRNRMIMFSVMVLLLTIGGVVAFLQRNIFLPLRAIREFTSGTKHGTVAGKITGISGELAELAGDVRALAARLETSEQKIVDLQSRQPHQGISQPP